jgi:dTDP-4-amino-4,6-dideoxygalactose transaminase
VDRRLELLLCQIHQRKYCVLIGNATVGLCLALKAHGLEGKKVAISNGVCPNVPLSVYLAGATPIYLDISRENLGLSLGELKNAPEVEAVIAVHAYGVPCAMVELETYCAEKGIILIEDMAVAQGATIHVRPVGSYGAVSVVSFGVGKVVDVGRGGALLTDDIELYKTITDLNSQLPPFEDGFLQIGSEMMSYHTKLYNEVYLKRQYHQLPDLFKQHALDAGFSFLYQFASNKLEKEIYFKLQGLQKLIQGRQDKLQFLIEKLYGSEKLGVGLFNFSDGSVPWRCNLLVDNNRDQLLSSLLNEKLKISSWYPSVDLFFEKRPQSLVSTPVSDDISDKILNIWINETVEESYLNRVSQRIIDICVRDVQTLN